MKGYIIACIGGLIIFNDYLANFSSRTQPDDISSNFPRCKMAQGLPPFQAKN